MGLNAYVEFVGAACVSVDKLCVCVRACVRACARAKIKSRMLSKSDNNVTIHIYISMNTRTHDTGLLQHTRASARVQL